LSNKTPPAAASGANVYLSAWMTSTCDVLDKITGNSFTAADLTPEELAGQVEALKEQGVWLRFTVETAFKGEHSFGISKSDALRLAQILMGEPFDQTQDFSAEYQDALAELFRQFAGEAAQALRTRAGGEVRLDFTGYGPASWKAHTLWGVRLQGEAGIQFVLVMLLDAELGGSLAPGPSAKAAPPSRPSKRRTAATPKPDSENNRNIRLILDVELPVFLRFGKREMLLRDILELSAGAVVELDQKILEPVELLVGSKVVARGEVVVMDAHYALRVTEVVDTLERIESLAA